MKLQAAHSSVPAGRRSVASVRHPGPGRGFPHYTTFPRGLQSRTLRAAIIRLALTDRGGRTGDPGDIRTGLGREQVGN